VTSSAMDISHSHADIKDLFMMSNATTIQTRMAATVLIFNYTTSFKDTSHYVSYVSSRSLLVLLVQLMLFPI
jgi:hypothetical protein